MSSIPKTVSGSRTPFLERIDGGAAEVTIDDRLVAITDPQGAAAEQYRMLLHRLRYARCRQALELGELERVEGSPDRAAAQYRLVAEMDGCPSQDRAWALLLLQRMQVWVANMQSALGSAFRIASGFSDE